MQLQVSASSCAAGSGRRCIAMHRSAGIPLPSSICFPVGTMAALTRTVTRFTQVIVKVVDRLRGARVIHTAHHGDLRIKIFHAPTGFWSSKDTIVLEAPHGFGRWSPVSVLEPDDLASAVRLLSDTVEWYHTRPPVS